MAGHSGGDIAGKTLLNKIIAEHGGTAEENPKVKVYDIPEYCWDAVYAVAQAELEARR